LVAIATALWTENRGSDQSSTINYLPSGKKIMKFVDPETTGVQEIIKNTQKKLTQFNKSETVGQQQLTIIITSHHITWRKQITEVGLRRPF